MKIIGVTGGIGSGKSIVCHIFNTLGVPIYESDKAAHRLYDQQELISKVSEIISEEVIDKSGKLNRKKLAEIVFNDEDKLQQLNRIVHPAVQSDFLLWVENHKGFSYVIKEAAILFESSADKQCDKTITISSPVQLRITRIRERDNRTKTEIENVIARQMSEEERNSKADYIIYNDDKQMVIPQVLALHSMFNK